MNLSTNSTSLLQICSDGGDGASPNFMILVLAQLVLRPSLQSSVSKMANADEMSAVDDAVEQIRGSHTTLSNSAGDGEPVGESVVDADTAGCVCVQSF